MTTNRNARISVEGRLQLDRLEKIADDYGEGLIDANEFKNGFVKTLCEIHDEEVIMLVALPFWKGSKIVDEKEG